MLIEFKEKKKNAMEKKEEEINLITKEYFKISHPQIPIHHHFL